MVPMPYPDGVDKLVTLHFVCCRFQLVVDAACVLRRHGDQLQQLRHLVVLCARHLQLQATRDKQFEKLSTNMTHNCDSWDHFSVIVTSTMLLLQNTLFNFDRQHGTEDIMANVSRWHVLGLTGFSTQGHC